VADLGEEDGGPAPPLFWVKNIAEERKAGRVANTAAPPPPPPPPPPPYPLAEGLDPPLIT